MDGGLILENALRYIVREQPNMERFADTVRGIAIRNKLDAKARDALFGELAEEIKKYNFKY